MAIKYCAACGRAVSQNYCPACGGTKFSTKPAQIKSACERCGKPTDRKWACAACKRTVCDECIRSYKYLTTLCVDCLKIQHVTSEGSDSPKPMMTAKEVPMPAHMEPPESFEIMEPPAEHSLIKKIKSALGGVFR